MPSWDEAAVEVAADYWQSRGFTSVHLEPGPGLRGRRGSDAGSFFPFFFFRSGAGFWDVDWTRIWARLTMAPSEFGGVHVDLEVTPGGGLTRRVTEWGPAFYRLEIAELQHLLFGTGDLKEVWNRFTEAERRGTALWLWTKRFAGNRLSEDWEAEILELEAAFLLAGEDPPKQIGGFSDRSI